MSDSVINDADKVLLDQRLSECEFADDVTQFQCERCKNVAITHYLADCGHVFCDKCQLIFYDSLKYNCHKCQQPITSMSGKDPEFEMKLSELATHCPNKKRGCKTTSMLIELPSHLKRCKHVMVVPEPAKAPETNGDPTMKDVLNQMQMMMSAFTNLQQQVAANSQKVDISPSQPKPQKISKAEAKLSKSDEQLLEIERLRKQLADYEKAQNKQLPTNQPNIERKRTDKMDSKPLIKDDEVARSSKADSQTEQIGRQKFKAIPYMEYNILLMGQTGVGKSTFINAFANYLSFDNLKSAEERDPLAIIPCKFSISDENFKQQTVKLGDDRNENMESRGESATQSCKSYEFPIDDFVLRIIDTPGIGDTRGIEQDRANLDGILSFISNYDNLYAICILLKPNESRLTPLFSFCIKQLLCHLHHNASNNIVFVFTNSRNTFYRPGDTIVPLTALLDKIRTTPPYPKIPFERSNIFCLDNEAFRFLVALKNGIHFSQDDRENFGQSWVKSVEESNRMIRYIVEGSDGKGLTPHNVYDTLSVNQARDAIIDLARPISDLTKNIQANLQVLNQRKKEIENCKDDEAKLRNNLYMPVVTLDIKELDKPRTVCTGESCRQPHQVGTQVKYHYPQKCHDPCYLEEVPRDVVGDEALRHCAAINSDTAMCDQCGCHYSKHLHIYYESEIVESKVVDQNIQSQLSTRAGTIQAAQTMVQKLEAEINKYESEEKLLTDYTAKLAVFLKHNAMVVCNDAFKEYLSELIENEKSLSKHGSQNAEIIKGLQNMLNNYETEKMILEQAIKNPTTKEAITTRDVEDIINKIAQMNVSGVIFKKSIVAQNKAKGGRNVFQKGKDLLKNLFT